MIVTIISIGLISALMLFFNALYVAGEFAAVSARKARITQAAQSGNRLAGMLLPIISDAKRLDNYIAASQVGITISSIVLGIYGQQQIVQLIEPSMAGLPIIDEAAASVSAILVLVMLTTLQVVLGELVPKTLALRYPEKMATLTVIPMRWSSDIILKPLIILLNGSGTAIMRLLGMSHTKGHHHIHSPEEINILISESSEGGLINAEERRLLNNAFRVGTLAAGEVVIPRNHLTAASAQDPVSEILRTATTSAHTRIPIYESDIDHLLGFVHLKDLFAMHRLQQDAGDVRTILRQAPLVPETMSVTDVWITMNNADSYIAFVFDEHGGTVGMISREDLIEELFGEVQDEFDQESPFITPQGKNRYLLRSDTTIARINKQLAVNFPETSATTIAGFIMHETGGIPDIGDEITVNGVHLKFRAANSTRYEVLLTIPDTPSMSTNEENKR